MIPYVVAGVALVAVLAARFAADRIARREHLRVGRWGRILSFRRTGGACLKCDTDWRWAQPHDTPLREQDGYCVFPLCQSCWTETPKAARLPYYARLLEGWAASGTIEKGSEQWDETRVAMWAAVEAGL